MLIQDLILEFRNQIDDLEPPFLISDTEALLYVIDAQDMFVRNILGISDYSTTALIDIAVVANIALAAISPYILRIRSAKLITAKRNIPIISESGIQSKAICDYGFLIPTYLDDTDTGEVVAAVAGVEDNKLRWWHVPTTNDTCRLHIYRLPYPRITTQESTLEIETQHHFHLIPWMKFLAYSKPDAEIYDKNAAELNKTYFEEYCAKARQENERKRYKPRVVQYGGL